MAQKTVHHNSVVVASPEHVATDLAGKTALLSLKNRTYYTLDEVGSPIWSFIQTEKSIEDVQQMMIGKYEVDPIQCQQDLLVFLQKLADLDLIDIK